MGTTQWRDLCQYQPPIAGATHDAELPRGKHPFQLYSMGTPNGVKVTVMFEELLAAGHADAEYDAWLISIGKAPVRQRVCGHQPKFKNPCFGGLFGGCPAAHLNLGQSWSIWRKIWSIFASRFGRTY